MATGQGLLGNNMFTYCNNSPIAFEDSSGNALKPCIVAMNDSTSGDIHIGTTNSHDLIAMNEKNKSSNSTYKYLTNDDVEAVYDSEYFAFYQNTLVIRHSSDYLTSCGMFGIIFLNHNLDNKSLSYKTDYLNHEYGHTLQERDMGTGKYLLSVFVPSASYNLLSRSDPVLSDNYYNMPWVYDADMRGGVSREEHSSWASMGADLYFVLWGE